MITRAVIKLQIKKEPMCNDAEQVSGMPVEQSLGAEIFHRVSGGLLKGRVKFCRKAEADLGISFV
jgi:hypothetical protein